MQAIAELYRECVEICSATDFGSRGSVKRHNAAVDRMRRLVADHENLPELLSLLSDPQCARWLAFQLVELTNPPPETKALCLDTIRLLASGNDAVAIGAHMWLRQRGLTTVDG